jgi:hypothetical protein
MKLQTAKCTVCGASLKLEIDKAISECSYCKSQIIVSNALDFAKVKLDRSEDIKKYRENLAKFVKNNSLEEILRVSNLILDILPNDYVASYYFAYAKQQKNEPKFMYEFLDKPLEYTNDDLDLVIDHLISNSDLRDENRVVRFLKAVSEEALASYRIELSKRLEIEDNYVDIPRDIFICHSSKNEYAVKQVVKVLEDDSNSCWISYRNLKPNDVENYWSNIEKAIINSSLILVISSEEAMRSKDVSKELELAQKYKKRLIEYKIDNKPHNSLYSHIFDGVKWVEGTSRKGLNDLKTRIFEEKKLIKDKKNPTSYVNTGKTNSKLGLIIGGLLLSISVVVGVVVFNSQSALSTSDLQTSSQFSEASTNSQTLIDRRFIFDKENGKILFYDPSYGSSVIIPEEIDGVKVKVIGREAFREKGLVSVIIPDTVETIEDVAFGSNFLTKLEIGNSVKSIDWSAFAQNSLFTLTIPGSVRFIGSNAFMNNSLKHVIFMEGIENIGGVFSGLATDNQTRSFAHNNIENLTLPNSLKYLGDAFYNNPIKNIVFGDSLKIIDDYAFYGPNKIETSINWHPIQIESLTIPDSIEKIGQNAFLNAPLNRIEIKGDPLRFNNSWEQIGFPTNLKP